MKKKKKKNLKFQSQHRLGTAVLEQCSRLEQGRKLIHLFILRLFVSFARIAQNWAAKCHGFLSPSPPSFRSIVVEPVKP